MAYALPRYRTPEPGQRLGGLPIDGYFYVHIWDFNKRAIDRSENTYNPNSPDFLIRKSGRLVGSCYDGEIISNHPYTATVCRTPFSTRGFDTIFLEQDWLTFTMARLIQVLSPVQTEVRLVDLTD
ncbi:hypothetical protein BDR05DRAFT_1001339 [Suillus weaverae]|nr:hypothetical protein BDR05DRAFT_1004793 [Suillus weaverae]KAG2341759.1 hypothetical protein BDR05DRAFT_1001339 [Suillus weaverae]